MDEFKRIAYLYRLKEVMRVSEAGGRRESTAEHTWSMMVLAEYFYPQIERDLDLLKIHRLIIFHDLVELEAGDTFVLSDKSTQREREHKASLQLKDKLPGQMQEEYLLLWTEYNDRTSIEARFCWAIDKLDSMVQNLFDKEIWQRYRFTEEKLRASKQKYFEEFPVMLRFFEALLAYMRENGYFER